MERLDHEEQFLFKQEVQQLAEARGETGALDNVEDLLTDVITSPRFDSEVFTLERSLQVMLGARPGTTLVGLLTVAPEVFDEVAEVRILPEVHERLGARRGRRRCSRTCPRPSPTGRRTSSSPIPPCPWASSPTSWRGSGRISSRRRS